MAIDLPIPNINRPTGGQQPAPQQPQRGTLPPGAPPLPTQEDLIRNLLDEEKFKKRRQDELTGIEQKRDKDLQSGRDFIKDFSLQQITETPFAAENLQLKNLLESRLGGLNAGEGAALREQSFRGLDQQRQGDLRALRNIQGTQGVRGPAAVAQQQNVFSQAANRGSDLEQQLLLTNMEIQRQAAENFKNEIDRQGTQQLDINQFNIGQKGREDAMKNAFPFLFANLGTQEQAAATGNVTGRDNLIASLFPQLMQPQAAPAPAPAPGGGGGGGGGGGLQDLLTEGLNPTVTGTQKILEAITGGGNPTIGGFSF